MPSKPRFIAPPEELSGVLDMGAATPKRKKKVKLKLNRRAHAVSPHVLNLKDKPVVSSAAARVQEKPQPGDGQLLTIHLDAEKTITVLKVWYDRWKSTLSFLAVGLLCVFGLRAINWLAEVKRQDFGVYAQGKEGVQLLTQGAKSLFTNPNDAAAKFQSSLHQLLWAKQEVGRLKSFHLQLLGEKKIDAALALARAFKEMTVVVATVKADAATPLDRLNAVRPHLVAAEHYAAEAERLVSNQPEITQFKNLIHEQLLLVDDLAVILGKDQWKRYLVLFQNNTELRATGGFIGSFAVVDIDQGKIKNIEIPKGGSYDLQGQLKAAFAPPKPLQLVKSRWEFQDANWFPDFPTSAQKIAWFYSQSAGRTVDGVIAINTNIMLDLLAITGPIDMPAYHRTITKDNFLLETQKIVELEYDKKANTPKAFIGDLAKEVMTKLQMMPRERYADIAMALLHNVENKNISVYLSDANIEKHIAQLGLAGEIHQGPSDEDYLGIIHTNIAGQKSDQSINESVSYEPTIAADGSVQVALTIDRTHEAVKGELFRGVRNVDFMRIYVPRGATLVSASGFEQPPAGLFKDPKADLADQKDIVPEENAFAVDLPSQTLIYNQFNKTVFGNWVQVDPGHTTTVSVVYKLPFKIKDAYNLFVQKQSGMRSEHLDVRVHYDGNDVRTASGSLADDSDEQMTHWQTLLDNDTQFSLQFKKAYLTALSKQ